jgi:hypothetical protein
MYSATSASVLPGSSRWSRCRNDSTAKVPSASARDMTSVRSSSMCASRSATACARSKQVKRHGGQNWPNATACAPAPGFGHFVRMKEAQRDVRRPRRSGRVARPRRRRGAGRPGWVGAQLSCARNSSANWFWEKSRSSANSAAYLKRARAWPYTLSSARASACGRGGGAEGFSARSPSPLEASSLLYPGSPMAQVPGTRLSCIPGRQWLKFQVDDGRGSGRKRGGGGRLQRRSLLVERELQRLEEGGLVAQPRARPAVARAVHRLRHRHAQRHLRRRAREAAAGRAFGSGGGAVQRPAPPGRSALPLTARRPRPEWLQGREGEVAGGGQAVQRYASLCSRARGGGGLEKDIAVDVVSVSLERLHLKARGGVGVGTVRGRAGATGGGMGTRL